MTKHKAWQSFLIVFISWAGTDTIQAMDSDSLNKILDDAVSIQDNELGVFHRPQTWNIANYLEECITSNHKFKAIQWPKNEQEVLIERGLTKDLLQITFPNHSPEIIDISSKKITNCFLTTVQYHRQAGKHYLLISKSIDYGYSFSAILLWRKAHKKKKY